MLKLNTAAYGSWKGVSRPLHLSFVLLSDKSTSSSWVTVGMHSHFHVNGPKHMDEAT